MFRLLICCSKECTPIAPYVLQAVILDPCSCSFPVDLETPQLWVRLQWCYRHDSERWGNWGIPMEIISCCCGSFFLQVMKWSHPSFIVYDILLSHQSLIYYSTSDSLLAYADLLYQLVSMLSAFTSVSQPTSSMWWSIGPLFSKLWILFVLALHLAAWVLPRLVGPVSQMFWRNPTKTLDLGCLHPLI